jgi:hypothetical protein
MSNDLALGLAAVQPEQEQDSFESEAKEALSAATRALGDAVESKQWDRVLEILTHAIKVRNKLG